MLDLALSVSSVPVTGAGKSLAAKIMAMSPKLWLEPSTADYQDSAGTLLVTQPGGGSADPPVGLVLDKSQGLVLGPELVTAVNPLNATISASAFPSTATATGSGTFGFAAAAASIAYKNYSCNIEWSGNTAGRSLYIDIGDSFNIDLGVGVSGSKSFTRVGGLAGSIYFYGVGGAPGDTLTAAQFTVREIPGNHAIQATSTARPKLSARVNLLTKTEDFSAAVWAKVGGATVSTPGAIAPDGSATAFDVTFTVGSGASQLYGTGLPTIAVPTKQRVYLRSATGVNIFYGAYDGGGTGGGGSNITPTSTWTAYDVSLPAFTGSDRRPLWLYSSAAGQQFQIWHPQLELGSTASRYQRVTDASNYDYSGFPLIHQFDGVDDAHVITFPSSLGSACTVVTANRGTTPTIQTGQTIGTSYTISTTHAGKLIFPRALTAGETAIVTAWATKQGAIA